MADLTHLSLFSGIGGLDLAAEWAGFRTVGQCEWADYPRAVLEKHWPGLPRWRDIRTLTKESFYEETGLETVTVLSGGFPCQPFSTAGKRRGKEDDRYLWPEMLRVISEIRPCWVVGENVAGIVTLALDQVLSDLESISYACEAVILPACAVDAQHRRDRCAILAYSDNPQTSRQREYGGEIHPKSKAERFDLCSCHVAHSNSQGLQRSEQHRAFDQGGQQESYRPTSECCTAVADTQRIGLRQNCYQPGSHIERDNQAPKQVRGTELCTVGCCGCDVPYTDGKVQSDSVQTRRRQPGLGNACWWPAEPDVGRVAHGIPNRVDRLKCLGNAVVPQQFYPIFKAIADIENRI